MKLEELTLAELAKTDLNGAKVNKLLIEGESTSASFEINGMEIEFVIDSDTTATTTALVLNGVTYNEESALIKCKGWTDYVAAAVIKTIGEQQVELEKINTPVKPVLPVVPTFTNFTTQTEPNIANFSTDPVSVTPLTTTSTPVITPTPSFEQSVPTPVAVTPVNNVVTPTISDETTTTTTNLATTFTKNNEQDVEQQIAIAFEQGRKAGYEDCEMMNTSALKKAKQKATIIIVTLIVLFLLTFGLLYLLFAYELGFNVPEFLQFFN